MTRNNLTFNGVDFGSAFSAYIAQSSFLDGAAKDIETVDVIGRSGSLEIFNDRYLNLQLTVQMYITENMKRNMDAMRKFLASSIGYCRFEESLNPQEYRMASFKQAFAPGSTDANGGVVTLVFDAKPQRFLKVGDDWHHISSGNTINNMQLFASRPVLRITGSGTVNIGNQYITIATHPYEYIDIDCDMMNAYYESNNANQYVSFSTAGNIELKPGVNTFIYDVDDVSVQPRWFEI